MLHFPVRLLVLLFFFVMLLFPAEVFDGASRGLLLWFNIVLPTLLPFIILSGLLIRTHAIDLLAKLAGPLLRPVLGVSGYGSFAALTGFLCGYPMGSKVAADLLRTGYISRREAGYLLSFCNNASPIFIISYVALQNLKKESLVLPSLVILMASPILSSLLFRRLPCYAGGSRESRAAKASGDSPASGAGSPDLVGSCMMDGFESIVKVGGYIMLFSIALSLFELVPTSGGLFHYLFLPSLEVTNGVALLCASPLPDSSKFVLCMACTSFGGFCAAAQARCMIADTGLSIRPYIAEKLAAMSVASLLSVLYVTLFI